ncbi:p53 and DNA damage-regulated protein 1-like [Actinia tenebrosa]|uniref:P53 and DNA damage-regulated protein 1-like n=1 Tax=Actinia tenebrosa TaxID=6105 RepID=A0A6P8ISX4_ACTTE|nr:p53 and DNA damage-regulated protein 1-like [Actinia tenebrosa]
MADEVLLHRFTSHSLDKFAEIEELASEILSDREQIVELDRKRNSNREALRALKKKSQGEKSWVCFGNTFMKLSDSKTKEMLEQDQKNVNEELENLRKELKPKVAKLHELEGLPEVKGFNLSSMGSDEMEFIAGVK